MSIQEQAEEMVIAWARFNGDLKRSSSIEEARNEFFTFTYNTKVYFVMQALPVPAALEYCRQNHHDLPAEWFQDAI